MSAVIYIEGGGQSRDLHIRCREGFRRLLERCGYAGRMPRLFACGSRHEAFDDFCTAVTQPDGPDFVGLLVDSEEPVANIEAVLTHLAGRDNWQPPDGVTDENVLLMATCMETWIVCDQATLAKHYGKKLRLGKLPPLIALEKRTRHAVQAAIETATQDCTNSYSKGKRSFEVLGELDPTVLLQHLPSFGRLVRILNQRL